MKQTQERVSDDCEGAFEKFDRLFRTVTSAPKSEVERLEAKERTKNRRSRAQEKAGKRKVAKKRKHA